MYDILLMNKISPAGLSQLDPAQYHCADDIAAPDAIMVRSASLHEMQFNPKTKAIARAGAGVNNIPCEECVKKGIVVFNTPGANANAVKELAILGLLIGSRKVADALAWAQGLKGNGDQVGKMVEKGKNQFAGPEIQGKTLGVVGLGAIGVLVANAAVALGMKVLGYDPYLGVKNAWSLSPSVTHVGSLDALFAQSDYITLHIPFTPDTKDTVNAESIAKMKNGVRILNFARGALVNSQDIVAALQEGKVAAYVTDFPDDTVLGVPGVVAIPHLGASTPESEDNCATMAAQELKEYLENGNITNSVNLPNVSSPRTGDLRICVIHENAKGIIAQITTILGDSDLNIENMVNASKKEYAYSIFDITGTPTGDALDQIAAVPGVIKVRTI